MRTAGACHASAALPACVAGNRFCLRRAGVSNQHQRHERLNLAHICASRLSHARRIQDGLHTCATQNLAPSASRPQKTVAQLSRRGSQMGRLHKPKGCDAS